MAPKPPQSVLLLLLFLIISNIIPVMASLNTVTFDLFRRNVTAASPEPGPLNCTTDFSADYYGFGVRLGIYFAWLSSYFANTLLPSEISGSLDTNSIFLLALIASLFKGSLNSEISQIDGLIIMQLSSGFLFSTLSIWGYRTSHYQKEGPAGIRHFGKFGTHCRLALAVAISMYGTWFWWEGLQDGLVIAKDPQCQQLYTWLLWQWPVHGGISKFYIVMSFVCSIYYGTMFLAAVLAGIFKLLRVGWKGEMKFATGFSVWELNILFNIFRVFNLFWIVFCASMIEMTLNKNHMLKTLAQNGKIAYPAQLLPLIVGALSFLRVLWLIYAGWKKRVKKVSSPSHTHLEAASEATTKPLLHNWHAFSLDIIKNFSPSARSDTTPAFELEQPNLPYTFRSWHLRYLVALLPWLSTFDFWRIADRCNPLPDIERSPPSETIKGFEEDSKECDNSSRTISH